MRNRASAGITLIEVILVIVIGGAFVITVGTLLSTAFSSWIKASSQVSAENDSLYFRRMLERQFRSATNDSVTITNTSSANDTLRFATYQNDFNVAGLYTQIEYKISGNELQRTSWDSIYTNGVLTPASPWGSGGTTQTILPNVVSLNFAWAGWETYTSSSAISVSMAHEKALPNSGVYIASTTFCVKSRNRGR